MSDGLKAALLLGLFALFAYLALERSTDERFSLRQLRAILHVAEAPVGTPAVLVSGADSPVFTSTPSFEARPIARRSAVDDTPILIRALKDQGSFKKGRTYLFWHDSGANKDHVSEMASPAKTEISGSPNYASGERSVWGQRLVSEESKKCFVAADDCLFSVLGPLFDPAYPDLRKRFDLYVTFLVGKLGRQAKQLNGESPLMAGMCPKDPNLPLRYLVQRQTALDLEHAAHLMKFVYRIDERKILADQIDATEKALTGGRVSDLVHSAYRDCFGSDDFQTLQMVAHAVAAVQTEQPLDRRRGFLSEAWKTAMESGLLSSISSAVEKHVPEPNAFAQVLTLAELGEPAGWSALATETLARGATDLLNAQALKSEQKLCKGLIQLYGGWYHIRDADCVQRMGFHVFIVQGLLALGDHLSGTNCAEKPWKPICDRLDDHLAAALAWILGVQDPQSHVLWSVAPGSETGNERSSYGNASGVSLAYQILDHLALVDRQALRKEIPIDFSGRRISVAEAEANLEKSVRYGLDQAALEPSFLPEFLMRSIARRFP